MLNIGLPQNISQDLLSNFPNKMFKSSLCRTNLDHDVDVEFWIPPDVRRPRFTIFPHLRGVKVVQSLLAGLDWILPWLPKGIILCDGQGVHNIPVAEWIVAAILGTLKRFPEYRDRQQNSSGTARYG